LIVYEYPFNERIRTLLRLEDLYEKFKFFVHQEHPLQHHVALATIFDMLEVAGRADLKSDLLQELERQKQSLLSYRSNPAVAAEALDAVLAELDTVSSALAKAQGKTGQNVRDNEWLMSIRGRTIMPGGACEFDLPSYYAWQQRPPSSAMPTSRPGSRRWRRCSTPCPGAAPAARFRRPGQDDRRAGSYQQMLQGKVYQMLRLALDEKPGRDPRDLGQQIHAVGALHEPGRRPETEAARRRCTVRAHPL
jgi:cell division protein ZapD